jgi:hypothetical protein
VVGGGIARGSAVIGGGGVRGGGVGGDWSEAMLLEAETLMEAWWVGACLHQQVPVQCLYLVLECTLLIFHCSSQLHPPPCHFLELPFQYGHLVFQPWNRSSLHTATPALWYRRFKCSGNQHCLGSTAIAIIIHHKILDIHVLMRWYHHNTFFFGGGFNCGEFGGGCLSSVCGVRSPPSCNAVACSVGEIGASSVGPRLATLDCSPRHCRKDLLQCGN